MKASLCQCLQQDVSLACKRVLRRRNDHVRLRREYLGDHVGIFGWMQHHGEIGRVLPQLVHDFLAVVDAEPDGDVFVAAAEFSDEAGEEIIAGADHRDIERAAAYPF